MRLRNIVSQWYFILRNLALLVLMLILIYTGIRIVTGSTAGEKAKYKERLVDWLVAICLVMIMHYIMVFAVTLVEEITELVSATTNGNVAVIELTEMQQSDAEVKLEAFGNVIEDGKLYWLTDLFPFFLSCLFGFFCLKIFFFFYWFES